MIDDLDFRFRPSDDGYHFLFFILLNVLLMDYVGFSINGYSVESLGLQPSLWYAAVIGSIMFTLMAYDIARMVIENELERRDKPLFGYKKIELPTTDMREVYHTNVIRTFDTNGRKAKLVEENGKEVLYEK